MDEIKRKLTLDQPAKYQIRVPGSLDEYWTEWEDRMTVSVESAEDSQPVTIMTGVVDQAALVGIIRRLYSIGMPLISVICVEMGHAVSLGENRQNDAGCVSNNG